MSADAFFRMGSTHSICQDYAIAGTWSGLSCAIVSDGCSGADGRGGMPDSASGAPFTDWGARLLVQAARSRLKSIAEGYFSTRDVIWSAKERAQLIGMPASALDATLLVAVQTPTGGVQVFSTADGVVAWRDRSGYVRYESIRFARGMPRYLSYLLDPDRHARLFEKEGESDDLLAGSLEITSNVYEPNEGWGPQLLQTEFFTSETPYERAKFLSSGADFSSNSSVDVVALFSDGVESFVDRDQNPVPLETVLVELLALKNLHGQFVTRRCKKFLEKVCAERGWRHTDDFSMAAVGFEGEAVSGQPSAVSSEKKESGGESS